MQMYGNLQEFRNFPQECIVWVGNIMTPETIDVLLFFPSASDEW